MFAKKSHNHGAKKKPSAMKRLFTEFGRDPETDWSLILILFMIIVVVLLCFSAFLLFEVKKGSIFLSTKKEPFKAETLNAKELSKVIDYYEKKKQKFEVLKTKPPVVESI
jgi:hypothetical protein